MIFKLLFTLVLCFAGSYGQPVEHGKHTKVTRSNVLSITPAALLTNAITVNYEHLFDRSNAFGLQITCMYGTKADGFCMKMDYRRHYFKKPGHLGLKSPYWGPFLYYEKSTNKIPVDRDTFTVDYTAFKAGVQWGWRWVLWNRVSPCFSIGYGLPVYTGFTWLPYRHEDGDFLELIATLQYGVIGELSIGVVF